jgi:succinoglycan biosynthesis protein ExoA
LSVRPAGDPTVTVVIPMRNEAASIHRCLESVLQSRLVDGDSLEVLVLDGDSTDASAATVAAIAQTDDRVRLIANPARLQAAAFNRALAEARGQYFLRIDAHSQYADDYVAESLRLLDAAGAENVGGVQRAAGTSPIGRVIAAAVSSRFAAGDAKYRHATTPSFTDTVYLGCWRTETLRRLGGMREDWAVNEDYELNIRLRAAGGRVYLSPTIRSTYFVRASFTSLARQYARYGFWKVRTLMEHAGSLRWRQTVAPTFVLSLLATWPLIRAFGVIGTIPVVAYGAANLSASIVTAAGSRWRYLPMLPLVFLIIHVAWGSGFLAGLCYWPTHRTGKA